jgi:hypothetical protein
MLQQALARPVSQPPRSVPAAPTSRVGCREPRGAEYFFPPRVLFDNDDGADLIVRSWYSKILGAAREPSLSCDNFRHQSFRFTHIPTFHAPSFVRVEISTRSATLWAGLLSGAGGYEPGQLVRQAKRELLETERRELAAALARFSVWDAATSDHPEKNGFDGTQWVLEARSGAAYHVVQRWSPRSGAFRELCLALASLGIAGPYEDER